MTTEESIRLIASFLGGGLVAGILNWIREARSEKRQQHLQRIRKQLEELYGPLHFFASQNDGLFALVRKIHDAYDEEYSSRQWSQSEPTQSNLREDTQTTIELANSYVATAMGNSAAMEEILKANYAQIDAEDEELFSRFILDQARLRQEIADKSPIRAPFLIYRHVGGISFMQPEFSKRIRVRFHEKKRQLGTNGD